MLAKNVGCIALAAAASVFGVSLGAPEEGLPSKVVGHWKCSGPFTATIEKHQDGFRYAVFMEGKLVWRKKLRKQGDKFVMIKAPFGEFYIIDEKADLRQYDGDGLIEVCKAIIN